MIKHALFTWLLTCFTGTLLLCVVVSLTEEGTSRDYYPLIALLGFGVSLIASIPAMALYGVLANQLRQRMPARSVRGIGSGYAVLATALTFLLLAGARGRYGFMMESAESLLLVAPYTTCFILAIWILPMPVADPVTAPAESESLQDAWEGNAPFPESAFYTIATVTVLEVCYSIWMAIMGGTFRYTHSIYPFTATLHVGLQIAGIILFLQKRPMGWKLLVFLFGAGLVGSLLGLISSVRVLGLIPSAQMIRFFGPGLMFIALDALCLALLLRPALRAHYRISEQDRLVCLLAGGAYGCLGMILMHLWR